MATFDEVLTRLDDAMQRIVDGEHAKEKFRADEEEGDKFRRRLYEVTKIEEMRRQIKIFYQNKAEKKLGDDSPVKVK